MLNEMEQIELIEKYFLGNLTVEEAAVFAEMEQNNPNFSEKKAYYQDFMSSIAVFGHQTLKNSFQELELEIQKEMAEAKANNLLENVKKQIDYTLEQLMALFRPIESYELAMSFTHRSEGFELVSPKNGVACKENMLYFELKTAVNQVLNLQIENNKQETILQQTIDANETFFVIDLPNNLQAGIYYWKLSQKTDTLIGSFYVQKDLMPL